MLVSQIRPRRLLSALKGLVCLCLAAGPLSLPAGAATSGSDLECSRTDIGVVLSDGGAESIAATLCVPPAATTVQVLLHGLTAGAYFWDFPYQPEKYSYVRKAGEFGFATLNIDRLGTGASSRPLSAEVDLEAHALVTKQLVEKLRSGALGTAFTRVVLVGQSYGTAVAWVEAGRYQNVDAIVATDLTHSFRAATWTRDVGSQLYPASSDPKFAGQGLDPGYITTRPGGRKALFNLDNTDPKVVALEESLKGTGTATELHGVAAELSLNTASKAINVPVFSVVGQRDQFFCGPGGTDCTSNRTAADGERSFYGPDASVDALVVPNAGHLTKLELQADWVNEQIQLWLQKNDVIPSVRQKASVATSGPEIPE